MPAYAYVLDSLSPFSDADRPLLEKNIRDLFAAQHVQVSKREVRFTSEVPPGDAGPILQKLSSRFGRIDFRIGTLVE